MRFADELLPDERWNEAWILGELLLMLGGTKLLLVESEVRDVKFAPRLVLGETWVRFDDGGTPDLTELWVLKLLLMFGGTKLRFDDVLRESLLDEVDEL